MREIGAAVMVVALAACSRTTTSTSTSTSTSTGTATSTGTSTKAGNKTLEPASDLTSLAARLRYEASHRPATGLKVEQVLAAIDAAGVHVPDVRQYLALAVHAKYCAGGTSASGLAVSVCEYATAEDAAAGKAFADARYAAMTDAERTTHGAALLTVAGPRGDAERALHAFQAL